MARPAGLLGLYFTVKNLGYFRVLNKGWMRTTAELPDHVKLPDAIIISTGSFRLITSGWVASPAGLPDHVTPI